MKNDDVVGNPDLCLGIISFTLPLLGFLIGVAYVMKTKKRDKETADKCFLFAAFGLLAVALLVYFLWG